MSAPVAARQNPFPGLRPFREDETQLFFGRENQVDAMVNKLADTRFLAVVGTSGSGKSSLVNCGLRPALHRGLMASAGPAWRVAQFRPGSDPIKSLAQALASDGVLYSRHEEEVPLIEIIETYLHQSAQGVIEAVRKARLPEGTNLLVVADQFEELFRFWNLETAERKDLAAANENAIAFVNLLLEAHTVPECPIYVVLTMRSDFLGDCSQFYGLPEAINRGQYLVPRMTRDERRASVAGPIGVGGAEISPVLLTRLVNDVGDNPDQLSILQHALNRTWARWESNGAQGEINLGHYTEIGTMSEALNQHANEAFDLLGESQQKICEKLFKALTDLGTDPRGIRRPLMLATLTKIAATDGEEKEVAAVIEVFRDPSRAFMMPPAGESLGSEKVIDISHESLMRVWKRLRSWAEEESVSARRYRRLAETAALEKTGNAALWSDPDLQLALDWKEEQGPTPTWASLYGGDFESAIAFLEKSQSQRDQELAEVIFARHWNRLRRFIILLVVAILLLRYRDLDRLSDWWSVEKTIEFHRHQRPDEVASNLWKMAKVVFALTCFLGPYFLLYLALAYPAKWFFRRLTFPTILREVALSSSKAVREEKLARQTVKDAAAALQTTYAGFWRRAGASALDLGLLMVAWVALLAASTYAVALIQPAAQSFADGAIYPTIIGGHWLYHALMLSSRRQATLGMLALGIMATDKNGNRLHFWKATLRHFAKILSVIPLGIGFFVQPFTPMRRTLHDLIAGSVVLVRDDKKKVPKWVIVLCIVVGLVDALPIGYLLAIAIVLLSMVIKKG